MTKNINFEFNKIANLKLLILVIILLYLLIFNFKINSNSKKHQEFRIIFYSIYLIISIISIFFNKFFGLLLLLFYFLSIYRQKEISHFMGQLGTGRIIPFNSNNNKLIGPGMNNNFSTPGLPGVNHKEDNKQNKYANTTLNQQFKFNPSIKQRQLPYISQNEKIIQFSYVTPTFINDQLI